MMPSDDIDQEEEEEMNAEDMQNEDKIAELMNKVLYLTEEDLK